MPQERAAGAPDLEPTNLDSSTNPTVAAFERQDRGAWHVHMAIDTLPLSPTQFAVHDVRHSMSSCRQPAIRPEDQSILDSSGTMRAYARPSLKFSQLFKGADKRCGVIRTMVSRVPNEECRCTVKVHDLCIQNIIFHAIDDLRRMHVLLKSLHVE